MATKVISFHYTLTDNAGKTLDSSAGGEPLMFMTGVGQIIPGLEKHLVAMNLGEKKTVKVPSEDAYGPKDPQNILEVPLDKLPSKQVKVGDQFRAGDGGHAPVVTVTNVTGTHATLDGNHPLAGQDLTFAVEIAGIREATAEELAHGHAHGPGGHHH